MSAYTCCRHCAPANPHHPAGPDAHDTACGSWCSESVAVSPQLDLFGVAV